MHSREGIMRQENKRRRITVRSYVSTCCYCQTCEAADSMQCCLANVDKERILTGHRVPMLEMH